MASENRAVVRSVDRFLVWVCPVLAVIAVCLAVVSLAIGEPVRAVWQFLLALLMGVVANAARLRLRRDAMPDERRR
ncbi:hypothetical protein ABT127_04415 [Streptomyces sp. NPDC001904]|uniref:hypothetical protein n=1 Tax=Streptomyces sp. NPDC001904 TaxID=3154531 RepID=UPI00331B43F5